VKGWVEGGAFIPYFAVEMVGPIDFEWDDAEAGANLRKHKLSFMDALAIFADPTRITIDTIRADDGEERRKTIGSIEGSLFTAVFVMRGTTCRLISARRANVQEERAYGQSQAGSRKSSDALG